MLRIQWFMFTFGNNCLWSFSRVYSWANFIHDFFNDIKVYFNILKCIWFEDDTNLYHSDSNWHRLAATLNSKLIKLSDWLGSNKPLINIKSAITFSLVIWKPLCDPELSLLIHGHLLERVDRTKFRGIIIDSKLTWSDHFQYISLKILKGLGIMCKLRNISPSSVLITLFYTLIQPYLTSIGYCSIIWGCANAIMRHKLLIL